MNNVKKYEKINHKKVFFDMLHTEKSRKVLIEYYEKYILNDIKKINGLKKDLYNFMTVFKNRGDIERSRKYYKLYQELKETNDYETVYSKLLNSGE